MTAGTFLQPHGVSTRVMSYMCFMNSKFLFRFLVDDSELMARHRPVSVHGGHFYI